MLYHSNTNIPRIAGTKRRSSEGTSEWRSDENLSHKITKGSFRSDTPGEITRLMPTLIPSEANCMETQANNFRVKILPKMKVCVEIPKLQNYLLGTPTSPHSDPNVPR